MWNCHTVSSLGKTCNWPVAFFPRYCTGQARYGSARHCSPVDLGSELPLLPVLHCILLPIVKFDPRGSSYIFSATCMCIKLRLRKLILITNWEMPGFKLVHVSACERLHACLSFKLVHWQQWPLRSHITKGNRIRCNTGFPAGRCVFNWWRACLEWMKLNTYTLISYLI